MCYTINEGLKTDLKCYDHYREKYDGVHCHVLFVDYKNDKNIYLGESDHCVDDALTAINQLDEKLPELRLCDPTYWKGSLFLISDDPSANFMLSARCSYQTPVWGGYYLNFLPTTAGPVKYMLKIPELKGLVKNFAYKGDIDELDLVLYTFDRLKSPVVKRPTRGYDDWGEIISRAKANLSCRNYRYKIDTSSINPGLLFELYPNMRYSSVNGAIRGTFDYFGDRFMVNLDSEVILDH